MFAEIALAHPTAEWTAQQFRMIVACDLCVSNSLSGRDWELDKVSAMGDPTHIVQLGTGNRVSAGDG